MKKEPEDLPNVNLNAPTSSEPGAKDPILARLEYEVPAPAADKKEGFLQGHMNKLPSPEHKGLSLENEVALSGHV